ncbi:hypothetical protein CANCADRAFT_30718 [Tortispora caseinolytica NRRL Y-17796]|uniref:Uncharacterized protein n=1 Tax=Tortispora caseinolytica NRRL Y-17796 TaxID=767744 RepID=A0A1E4TLH6_9ASCO|nr:hypothetical protein CANCADRAFT_30718 [Tortispora caseinolytica NRRL Y-17796]
MGVRNWYVKFKSMPFPWRKRILKGYDLEGNKYWEFKDPNNAGRMRRILECRDKTLHLADVKVPVQWSEWLRQVRKDPPTIDELLRDKKRLQDLQVKIKNAEERWRSIPLKTDPEPGVVGPKPVKSVQNATEDYTTANVKPRR